MKDLREDFSLSLYADLKDKIHHNALSDDELDRIIAFRGQEFEKKFRGFNAEFFRRSFL
ncbi:hypothetical protein VN0909_02440 [Helicobacter pylori]